MNLEKLLERAQEIDSAIASMSAQLSALHGHKTEVAHWLKQLQEESSEPNETQVEVPAEPVVQ